MLAHNRLTAVLDCCTNLIIEDAERASRGLPVASVAGSPHQVRGIPNPRGRFALADREERMYVWGSELPHSQAGQPGQRWRAFAANDNASLAAVDIAGLLRESLAAAAACGEPFQQAMAEVDPSVAAQVQQLGIV